MFGHGEEDNKEKLKKKSFILALQKFLNSILLLKMSI